MRQHRALVMLREVIRERAKAAIEEAHKLMCSGAVDMAAYDSHDFGIIKVLAAEALRRQADAIRPLSGELKAVADNLKNF